MITPQSLLVLGHCLEEDRRDLGSYNWKNMEWGRAVRLCDVPPSDRTPNIAVNPNSPKQSKKAKKKAKKKERKDVSPSQNTSTVLWC